MIALVVVSLIAAGSIKVMHSLKGSQSALKSSVLREVIRDNLVKTTMDSRTLNSSLLANAQTGLQQCLDGDLNTVCTSGTTYDFPLQDLSTSLVSGSGGAPVFYDIEGKRCAANSSPTCTTSAVTKLTPICAQNQTTCGELAYMRISILLETAQPNGSKPGFTNLNLVIPPPLDLNAGSSTANLNFVCPAGTALTQFSATAGPSCQNVAPAPSSGNVTLLAASCPNGQFATGVQADGSFICAAPPSQQIINNPPPAQIINNPPPPQATAQPTPAPNNCTPGGLGIIEYSRVVSGVPSTVVFRTDAPVGNANTECQNQWNNTCVTNPQCSVYICTYEGIYNQDRSPLPSPRCKVTVINWVR